MIRFAVLKDSFEIKLNGRNHMNAEQIYREYLDTQTVFEPLLVAECDTEEAARELLKEQIPVTKKQSNVKFSYIYGDVYFIEVRSYCGQGDDEEYEVLAELDYKVDGYGEDEDEE